jgi:hypothetical protein
MVNNDGMPPRRAIPVCRPAPRRCIPENSPLVLRVHL